MRWGERRGCFSAIRYCYAAEIERGLIACEELGIFSVVLEW